MDTPVISPELAPLVDEVVRLVQTDRLSSHQRCAEGLARAREHHDDAAFIALATQYALVIDQIGYPDNSLQVLYDALQMAQSYHMFADEAKLLNVIGRAVYTRAEYRRAMQVWARCLEASELAQDQVTWVWAKVGIAQIYDALGDHQTAVTLLNQASQRARALGEQVLLLNTQLNLGVNLYFIGEYHWARHAYEEVIDLARMLNNLDDLGETLFRLAEVDFAEGLSEEAMPRLDEAQTICTRTSHRWALSNIHALRARILAAHNDLDDALSELEQGLHYATISGSRHIEMRLMQQMADLQEARGEAQLALTAFRTAASLEQKIHPHNPRRELGELEDLAGLRPSPGRLLLDFANDPQLERCTIDVLARLVAHLAVRLFHEVHVSLWRFKADSGILRLRHAHPSGKIALKDETSPLVPDLISALTAGDTVVAHNAPHHPLTWQLFDDVFAERAPQALLITPLRLNEALQGVIVIERFKADYGWSSEEVQYANQLAIITVRALASVERRSFLADIAHLNAQLTQANTALEARVAERSRELERAMNHLVESEKMTSLGNLVAGFAHELNTPLGNALTAASSLSEHNRQLLSDIDAGQLRKSLLLQYLEDSTAISGLIERNTRRACDLIANLKHVAVDTASSLPRVFDLREIVDETLGTLHPTLKKRRVVVHNDVPSGIEFDSFPGAIEQVITNFVTNSLTHAFDSDMHGEIRIGAREEDDHVAIVYRDNGHGIADTIKKRVFDPFFTTRFGQGGSGLGLYLVYALVTGNLGGTISLDDGHPHGAQFTLKLPKRAPRGEGDAAVLT
ncbi:ATP-binding protein [Chitinibacteraceae bacterium HSL-7]